MNSYTKLDNILGTNNNIEVYRLTQAVRVGNRIEIHFNNYPIVTLYPDGDILIDNGGMKNRGVKDRMNKFLPNGHKIEINYGNWFIYCNGKVRPYKNPEIL
jgi:hypothetical protein